MAACMVDAAAMSEREVMLLTVPMFHVNAWGMPYSCTIAGAKQVLPGPYMIGQPVAELIEGERVTSAAGVPTIYNLLVSAPEGKNVRPFELEDGLDRRGSGISHDDGKLPARLRHHHPACLGNDGDIASGHDLPLEELHGKLA